jgi:S-adenosylmethionine synthetase
MFVCGGPNGDNGQTGKKLVMDAYGPTVPIGGGAWSGKDFWKVDRRGGLLARAMAQRLVEVCACDEARVTLEYYPGSDAPAHGEAIVDGRPVVLDCRALTGDVVVPKLQAIFTPAKSSGREFDLKEAARWGHYVHLGELWRELPDFVSPSSAMRSGTLRCARPREDLVGHLAD